MSTATPAAATYGLQVLTTLTKLKSVAAAMPCRPVTAAAAYKLAASSTCIWAGMG